MEKDRLLPTETEQRRWTLSTSLSMQVTQTLKSFYLKDLPILLSLSHNTNHSAQWGAENRGGCSHTSGDCPEAGDGEVLI